METADPVESFLQALVPLLKAQQAREVYLFGSRARGTAHERSDIDLIVVAPSDRPEVDRFRDYLPAIVASRVPVEMFVYTPDEFARLKDEERPFLMHALNGARRVYEG